MEIRNIPRVRTLLLATGIALLLASPQVLSIQNGQPDGDQHPYVGLVVFYDADGHPLSRCSGSFIAPRLFMTAGHCTSGAVRGGIWLDEDVDAVLETSNTMEIDGSHNGVCGPGSQNVRGTFPATACYEFTFDPRANPGRPEITVQQVGGACSVTDQGEDNLFLGKEMFLRGNVRGDWAALPDTRMLESGDGVFRVRVPVEAGYKHFKIADRDWGGTNSGDTDCGGGGYPYGGAAAYGEAVTEPGYTDDSTQYDLGMIVVDEPGLSLDRYALLPAMRLIEPIATHRGRQDVTFSVVGYGQQDAGPVNFSDLRIRLNATVNLVSIRGTANGRLGLTPGTAVMLTANQSTGGICFGDSGGPVLLDASDVVVAVNSWGQNKHCGGVDVAHRVDSEQSLVWIYSYFGGLLPP